MEASPHPERALPSALRLEAMHLSAGHLVHMPSHAYLRTGAYREAAQSDDEAVARDQSYLENPGTVGIYAQMYYSHNLYFLAVARSMQGRFGASLSAALKLAAHVAPAAPAMPMVEFFIPTPELVLVRFHTWPEIPRAGVPPPTPLTGALWHFARAMAYAGSAETKRARAEGALFREAAGKVPAEATVDLNKASDVLQVAGWYLEGHLARSSGNLALAAEMLRKGVAAEDALAYADPPSWNLPVREPLGGVQFMQGEFVAAEKTFREELARHPRSGRALYGLWQSLQGEGRGYEAQLVHREYETAWVDADVVLDREGL